MNILNAFFVHTESLCLKDPVTLKLWFLVASFVIVFYGDKRKRVAQMMLNNLYNYIIKQRKVFETYKNLKPWGF